jgi:hypothetical protein
MQFARSGEALDFSRGDCRIEELPRSQDSINAKIAQICPMPQLQDQFTPILDSFDMRWN